MMKLSISSNAIMLSGKGHEIKKALHALLQGNSSKTTVTQYVASCASHRQR